MSETILQCMSVCLCQTAGSLKQTMIHAMTSSRQTHDISGSVEKPLPATVSLFELGKRKNVNETYKNSLTLPSG